MSHTRLIEFETQQNTILEKTKARLAASTDFQKKSFEEHKKLFLDLLNFYKEIDKVELLKKDFSKSYSQEQYEVYLQAIYTNLFLSQLSQEKIIKSWNSVIKFRDEKLKNYSTLDPLINTGEIDKAKENAKKEIYQLRNHLRKMFYLD